MQKITPRHAALCSLIDIEKTNKYTNIEVGNAIVRYGFTGLDKAFFTNLVYGTTERRLTLDYIISKNSNRAVDKLDATVLVLLRLGVYQLCFLDRVPDSAAVNESVELTKKLVNAGAAGFVNAVLRSVIRTRAALSYPKDNCGRLSVLYSMPRHLTEMFIAQYGLERTESIFKAFFDRPYPTLRTNTLKISRDGLCNLIKVPYELSLLSKSGIRLSGDIQISDFSPLADGLCFIQDECSQFCAEALGALPGETVLDVCAAPGGKSFSLAINMENRGRVLAHDLHENKLSLIVKGAAALGIDIIETAVSNASVPDKALFRTADRVLCDVPCSGLGVIAKKPDLRYKNADAIAALPDVQYKTLRNSSEYVKDGGTLIYSTCTLNRAENEEVVDRFLAERPFVPDDFGMKTFYPDTDKTDGFFIAKMKAARI